MLKYKNKVFKLVKSYMVFHHSLKFLILLYIKLISSSLTWYIEAKQSQKWVTDFFFLNIAFEKFNLNFLIEGDLIFLMSVFVSNYGLIFKSVALLLNDYKNSSSLSHSLSIFQ